jgi:hypothetical protein
MAAKNGVKSRRIKFWILTCAASFSHRLRTQKLKLTRARAQQFYLLKSAGNYVKIRGDPVMSSGQDQGAKKI